MRKKGRMRGGKGEARKEKEKTTKEGKMGGRMQGRKNECEEERVQGRERNDRKM